MYAQTHLIPFKRSAFRSDMGVSGIFRRRSRIESGKTCEKSKGETEAPLESAI